MISAALLLAACGPAETASVPTASNPQPGQASTVQAEATLLPIVDTGTQPAPTEPVQAGLMQATPTAESRAPGTLPTGSAGLPIVANVNGAEIPLTAYQRGQERFAVQQIAVADESALRAAVLNTLIEQTLIDQAAQAQGVTVTPEEVEAEYQANAALAGSPEVWAAWLAENRYTEAEFRQELHATLITGKMRDLLTNDLGASVFQVHARHILVSSRELAQELIARLGAGEDFATLAAQYSNDITTRDQGGDLDWFAPEELLEPVLSQIAFTLEPGSIAGPVQSSLGYHILQVIEKGERELSETKRAELAARRFENWLDTLTSAAQIELFI